MCSTQRLINALLGQLISHPRLPKILPQPVLSKPPRHLEAWAYRCLEFNPKLLFGAPLTQLANPAPHLRILSSRGGSQMCSLHPGKYSVTRPVRLLG